MSTATERACCESLTLLAEGEEWYRAVALNVLGTVARYRGGWDEARRRYERGARAGRASATCGGRPRSHRRTSARSPSSRAATPRPWSATSRPSASRVRAATRGWLAMCLMNAGRAVRQLGDLDRASALHGDALRSFVALENAWGIAACLAAFAAVAADRGHHVRAARLYGAEEAIRERARIALWPTIRAEHDAGMEAAASAALGEAAWARARRRARALTQERGDRGGACAAAVATG